jgi:hypothetical protein
MAIPNNQRNDCYLGHLDIYSSMTSLSTYSFRAVLQVSHPLVVHAIKETTEEDLVQRMRQVLQRRQISQARSVRRLRLHLVLACHKLEPLKCAAEFIDLFHHLRIPLDRFRFEALDASETELEDAVDTALACI